MDCSLMAHRKRLMPRKILSYPIKTIYIEIITPLYYYVSYWQYSFISFDRCQCYLNLSIKANEEPLHVDWAQWMRGNHKMDLFYMVSLVCCNISLFPYIYHLKVSLCLCRYQFYDQNVKSVALGQNSAKFKLRKCDELI